MSSRVPDLLSNIFSSGAGPNASVFPRGVFAMKVADSDHEVAGDLTVPPLRRRTPIWGMHHSIHCSIIGTCLSGGEIRRLLIKLGIHGAETADDHHLHKQGVALAGKPHGGGKIIQKALDHRHAAAIKQFSKAIEKLPPLAAPAARHIYWTRIIASSIDRRP